jgi:hypothetical protein
MNTDETQIRRNDSPSYPLYFPRGEDENEGFCLFLYL